MSVLGYCSYTDYSELSDAVEDAISRWLSNPSNQQHLKNGRGHWMATLNFAIEGVHPRGFKVRMMPGQPIVLAGDLIETEKSENEP
jgi:hypothetical protein